jgi:EPS-associated MarR family transcriptional regulator
MPTEVTEKEFQLMEIIRTNQIFTQRQLASHAGFSLSKVNFVLQKLLEKGLVKIGNFKSNPKKIGYAYLLTPKGIEAKSKLAVRFVMAKVEEYKNIQTRIETCLLSMVEDKIQNIIFTGPSMIKDIVDNVISTQNIPIHITGFCENWKDLSLVKTNKPDALLLSDDRFERLKEIKDALKSSSIKLVLLWD